MARVGTEPIAAATFADANPVPAIFHLRALLTDLFLVSEILGKTAGPEARQARAS